MLNIKKILLFIILVLMVHSVYSNPFRNSTQNKKVPIVRTSGNNTPPALIKLQMDFRSKMAELLVNIKESKNKSTLFLLLFIGFLYGVIHAAGPGHRKTVLFTVFLSNKSKWWEPCIAGIISAFLHGVSGIALILIFKEFSTRLLTTRIDFVSKYMEAGSFILLLVMALVLFIHKLISIIKNKKVNNKELKDKKSIYYTIMLTSLFPCPGAILILVLSLSLNALNVGVLTVIFLSIGMGTTISFSAYLGRGVREGLFKLIKSKENIVDNISNYLEVAGYFILFIFSGWMMLPSLYNL